MEGKGAKLMHPPAHPPPGFSKKRVLDVAHLQNQPYYKIRGVLKDVRPHFLQVLRTPDFQNCEAATEIRQNLKVLLDLYKELMAETIDPEKLKDVSNLNKARVSGDAHEKPQTANVRVEGTYVIGGSAFGWNFITFPAINITYYGRTKESFRAINPKSQ